MQRATAPAGGRRDAPPGRASTNDADTANAILEALGDLSARLGRLEAALGERSTLETLTEQAPATVATAVDALDDALRGAQRAGFDLEARLPALFELAERLTRPETVGVLSALLERAGELEKLLALADEAPGLLAAAVDTLDGYAQSARAAGFGPEELLASGTTLLGDLRGATTHALAESRTKPLPTPFGVLRLLSDLEVRRALTFFLVLAKHLGRSLERVPTAPRP
ncbi:DUF1641 domain-containing protein [Truepera radiovictrix]|uniref:DUF1641 domain-containing protein n=1 Tax=Truepera radiovictrix (strain DSM 17093 / CIP 108686 / LMG 22925 / RQ-24) TaxID=649638 RepID=D7CWG8_TRURR|nr:DUF1641 domain-containing protein [Truepera radiovictrix]ADI14367.1 protein of unknown function DUF1641 [Truepera radiovictrix DSM 17093]WMT57076.1 DUF1641 domain-containing protein [Truepera radiovictrix]